MNDLAEIPMSTELSELNAFELTIQEHEKELLHFTFYLKFHY